MLLKSFRYLLFPFSLVYSVIIFFRNWLFDKNILKHAEFNFPIICVGNIAVGGTGKSPMVEYLIWLLKDKRKVATLSRGYKRKTTGFAVANEKTTALEIGDEPMQFHQKFKNITVSVGEERVVAIPQLLHDKPETEVIILDDAFQHRHVKAGLNIVLTEYNNLFTKDFMLPAGDLRDVRASMKRAEIIVVTKCKSDISIEKKEAFIKEINPLPHQKIFFTEIVYNTPYHLFSNQATNLSFTEDILLITGIANPKPLKEFLAKQSNSYEMIRYPDHHIFDTDDLREIKKQFEKNNGGNKIIVTTEKDAVRLVKFEDSLKDYPIYVLPIKHQFLFNEANEFDNAIMNYVNSFIKPA